MIQNERNYIMTVVFDCTQSKNDQICVGAFECLVKIMQLYYDKMPMYMEKGLYQVRLR